MSKYPSREYMCGRPFPHFPKLQRIFGRDREIGDHAETPDEAIKNMEEEEVGDTADASNNAQTPTIPGTSTAALGGGAASSSVAPDGSMASGSCGSRKRKGGPGANEALWALTDAVMRGFETQGVHMSDIAAAIRGKDSPHALGDELRKMGIGASDVVK
ncbi:hypothetical protein Tsubulata_021617, partial [Turnera subulata]